jgi:hypothetical protein
VILVGGDPSVVPIPIGVGPRFHPAAVVRDGSPVGGHACGPAGRSFRVHVELFAERKVVVIPAGIGVARTGCVYPARTRSPIGVVEVEAGVRLRLGDLFRIWGASLSPRQLLSFRSAAIAQVRAYVAGKRWRGRVTDVPLTAGANIVVEVGPYVPPHPTFLFPPQEDS